MFWKAVFAISLFAILAGGTYYVLPVNVQIPIEENLSAKPASEEETPGPQAPEPSCMLADVFGNHMLKKGYVRFMSGVIPRGKGIPLQFWMNYKENKMVSASLGVRNGEDMACVLGILYEVREHSML